MEFRMPLLANICQPFTSIDRLAIFAWPSEIDNNCVGFQYSQLPGALSGKKSFSRFMAHRHCIMNRQAGSQTSAAVLNIMARNP